MYGAQGTDITDPKSGPGSQFYRRWVQLQDKKANKYEEEVVIDRKEILRAERTFSILNDEIFGKIKLAEQGIKFDGGQ